jgi:hypothetical protein
MTDTQVIERVQRELLDGTSFRYKAQGFRSVPLGGGPATAREYASVITALGKFASMSDWAAHVTAKVIAGGINQYLTPSEMVAKIAESLQSVVVDGWFDVRGATGPEPGRRSSHQKPTTLRQALLLECLFAEVSWNVYLGTVPGLGWVVAGLIRDEGVTVYECYFPNVAKQLRETER